MSSFAGAVLLAPAIGDVRLPILSPPEDGRPGASTRLNGDGSAVAHRQRIVTPEDRDERQPWPAWGGRGWVCFAGRLDDRAALARGLGLDRPDEAPDGLLACRALERWGEDAPRHLLGDYALAAWHGGERRLILAADPLGARTVYYARQGDLVLLSSNLRALLASPQISRALDERYIADFMAMNWGDDDGTFYRDIRKVLPGTALVITQDRIQTVETHCFDPERRLTFKKDSDYVEAAREILDQTVKDRLRAVGPVPISASGGLDSACVAVSAHGLGAPVTLLCAVPEPGLPIFETGGGYTDERPFVEALAAAYPGMRAEFHPPSPDVDWSPDSLSMTAACASAVRLPQQMAWFEGVNRRAVAMGADSYLTGLIGNRSLTWDGRLSLSDMLRRGQVLRVARELVLGSRGNLRRLGGLTKAFVLPRLRGARYRLDDLAAFSPLRSGVVDEYRMMDRLRERGNDPGFIFPGDSRQVRIHQFKRNRGFMRACQFEGIRTIHGLDLTMPLGDVRMMEFCLAIPDNQYLRNGTDRYLARRLLRGAGAPLVVADNRRRGRQHPEWFAHLAQSRAALPAQIERLRRSPVARRLIDIERLDHLVATCPTDAAMAQRHFSTYSVLLYGALNVGSFIAWAEGTN